MPTTFTLPRSVILDADGALACARWCPIERVMIHEESFLYDPVNAEGEEYHEILDALYGTPHDVFDRWADEVGHVELDLRDDPFEAAREPSERELFEHAQATMSDDDHPDYYRLLYVDPTELLGPERVAQLVSEQLEAIWSGDLLGGARGERLWQLAATPALWFKDDGTVALGVEHKLTGMWRLHGEQVIVELESPRYEPYGLVADEDEDEALICFYEDTFEAITRYTLAPIDGAPQLAGEAILADDDARFGVLRSCAQGAPDTARWWSACVQLEGWEALRREQEVWPYLERILDGWPSHSRTLPPAWWARHLRGELEGAPVEVCDTWCPNEGWARSPYDLLALRQEPLVAHIRTVDLRGLLHAEEALLWLSALLHGPTWHELTDIILSVKTPRHDRVRELIAESPAFQDRQPPAITFT